MKRKFDISFDWKHWVMVILTSLGVVIPFSIWWIDNQGRSLFLTISTKIPLTILERELIPEMEVLFKGEKITTPYLSEIRVSNDSRKPIPATDFESPIEIRTVGTTRIHSARLKPSGNNEIDAKIIFDSSTVKVNPILLNPGEEFSISIVTGGSIPAFTSRGRISGVSVPPLQDASSAKKDNPLNWLYFIAALFLAVASSLAQQSFQQIFLSKRRIFSLRLRSILFIAVVTQQIAVGLLMRFLNEIGINSLWISVVLVASVLAVSALFAKLLNRPAPEEPANLLKEERFNQSDSSTRNSINQKNQTQIEPSDQSLTSDISEYLSSPGEIKKYITSEESKVPLVELDREKIYSRFYGANVDWELRVDRVDQIGHDRARVEASRKNEIAWANSGDMVLSENPDIKLLAKGTVIRMIGTIASIQSKDIIVLKNSAISIL